MKFISSIKKKNAVAEVSREIAQIFFGSMFIGPIVTKDIDVMLVLFGACSSTAMWLFSVLLSKD